MSHILQNRKRNSFNFIPLEMTLFCGASDPETGKRLNVRKIPEHKLQRKLINLSAVRLAL